LIQKRQFFLLNFSAKIFKKSYHRSLILVNFRLWVIICFGKLPIFWAALFNCHVVAFAIILTNNGWAACWANFSQTHRVALLTGVMCKSNTFRKFSVFFPQSRWKKSYLRIQTGKVFFRIQMSFSFGRRKSLTGDIRWIL
jgi:hypothetical protein